jgi:DNA-binding beta-propeller fold protein YncE
VAGVCRQGHKVLSKIKIGGEALGLSHMHNADRRLYVSRGTSVELVDVVAGKIVGTISGLHGVHGIAIAPDLNKGYITNGQTNSVTVFDLKTLAKTGEPATGKNPDAVCYEPKTKRVFAINHTGNDASVIDAKTSEIVATFELGPRRNSAWWMAPERFINLEGSSEM